MISWLKKISQEDAPDQLFATIANVYWRLHPNRENLTIVPYAGCWLVQCGSQRFFTPNPRRAVSYTRQKMMEKYTLKPFVDVDKGDIVFDVGAFIGGFTLAVVDKASKVFAIEPDPQNCAYLRANVKKLRNVHIIQKALWKHEGTMDLKLGEDPTDSSLLNVDGKSRNISVDIQSTRLDSLVRKLGIGKIDFLKMDAEGVEPEVLEGAEGILGKIRKVAVDCSAERFGRTTTLEVRGILASAGFDVRARKDIVYAWRD